MSLLETHLRDTLISIFDNPHRRAYLHFETLLNKAGLFRSSFKAEAVSPTGSSVKITYTSPGDVETECYIEIDQRKYSNLVYLKIGYKRKAFRLATIPDPYGKKDVYGDTEHIVKKDLSRDIGFQKAFFNKLMDYFEYKVKDDVESAGEKDAQKRIKDDMTRQFADWEVEYRYSSGWDIAHKTTLIRVRMTQQLDIEAIYIPADKYPVYPDDSFMARLVTLLTECPEDLDEINGE